MLKLVRIVSDNETIGIIGLLGDSPYELELDLMKYGEGVYVNSFYELRLIIDAITTAEEPYNILDLFLPIYEDSITITDNITLN